MKLFRLLALLMISSAALGQSVSSGTVKPGNCATAINSVSRSSTPGCMPVLPLLNSVQHSDTLPQAIKRGSLLFSSGINPRWMQLVMPPNSGSMVLHGGLEPRYGPIVQSDLSLLYSGTNFFTGGNTFAGWASSLRGALTGVQPGNPTTGAECLAIQGDNQTYATHFTTTDSSGVTHQVICGSKEGGIFFPLVWWNPAYDGIPTHGGGEALYINMSAAYNRRSLNSPDFVGLFILADSSNSRSAVWATNPLVNVCLGSPTGCVDATAWTIEADMNNAESEVQDRSLPFIGALHKIAIDADSGGVNASTYAYSSNVVQRHNRGFFDGVNLTGIINNGFKLTWKSSGSFLYANFQSSTSVSAGATTTMTVTCTAPSSACPSSPTTGMSTTNWLVLDRDTANEEYFMPGEWAIGSATTITVSRAYEKAHTQPFNVNPAMLPIKGVSIGDPVNYATSAAGFFRQLNNAGDGLTIQRRSTTSTNCSGSLFKLIDTTPATLGLIDCGGSMQMASYYTLAAGSAAAPVYSFVGNTNTGLFKAAGNYVVATSGGTASAAFPNVGIRTGSAMGIGFSSGTDPTATGQDTGIGRGGAGVVTVDTGTPGNDLGTIDAAKGVFGASTTSNAAINIVSGSAPTTPNAGDIWIDTTEEKHVVATSTAGAVKLYDSGGTNAVTITPNGSVTAYTLSIPAAAPSQNHMGMDCTTAGACVFSANGQTVGLTSAYTNATTGATNVTGLSFSVDASKTYQGYCELIHQVSANTAGLRITFTTPASPTAIMFEARTFTTATTDRADVGTTAGTLTTGAATTLITTNLPARIGFRLRNGANAGTLQLQAASFGTGTLTIQPDSFCVMQ